MYRNGQAVEGADHSTVVQLIRQSGKQVVLTIITVSEEEARRLEPDVSSSSTPGVEYYERRSVPVSIPETEKLSENGKEYVVSTCTCMCMYVNILMPSVYNDDSIHVHVFSFALCTVQVLIT